MNTTKFLPPSKYMSPADRMSASYDKKIDEVLTFDVKQKAIKVDKLLKNQLIQEKKKKKKKDIKKEQEKFNLKETLLETKKQMKGIRGIKLPSIPRMSFLDSIRNFITFTLLGIAVNQLFKYLPQLTDITKKMIGVVGTVGGFFEGIAKGLLNGFATFVHEGYKLRDGFKDFIGKKFGENAEKQFEQLEKQLNLFFDLSLLTGLLSLDIGMDLARTREGDKKGRGKLGSSVAGIESRLGRKLTPQELKDLGLKPGSIEAKGIQKEGTRAERAAAKQQKRLKGAEIRAGKAAQPEKLAGPFSKFAGPLGKFLKVAVPGVGAALGAIDSKARFAAGDNLGGSIAAASAALDAFVTLGAALTLAGASSIIGIPVAALTGTAATVAAGLSVALDVILLIRDVLEVMGIKVPGFGGYSFAQGGQVTRNGKAIGGQVTRTVKPVRRKESPVKPQKSQPGKDVGGRKEIQKLFSDPMNPTESGQLTDPDAINPLGSLETTSKILKTIPFLGGVMGSAVDLSIGERPSKGIFKSFGAAIGNLIQDVADNQISLSLSDVSNSISAMANGGQVESTNLLKENNIGYQIGSLVAKAFEGMIDNRVNQIFQELRKQFKKSDDEDRQPSGGDMGPIEYGPLPLNMSQKQAFATIYELAKSNGASMPELVAAMAMYESGYLTSQLAREANNPFGQTGSGNRGSIQYKGRNWAAYNSLSDAVKYHVDNWNNTSKSGKGAGTYGSPVAGLRAILPIYAPTSDNNNHQNYIKSVSSILTTMGFDPQKKNTQTDLSTTALIQQRKPGVAGVIPGYTSQPSTGYKPKSPGNFNIVQYITGDPSQGVNYDLAGHGRRNNYHDHIAFATEQDKERAKAALRAAGIKIGSEYRPGDPGYHGKNLAIDVPGFQWGGSGAIGNTEYDGSAKVRRILGLKDGGVVGQKTPRNIAPIKSYASYDSESQVIMMIQPVHYYTNTSNKSVSFPGFVVNNNNSRSNSTFFRQ